MSDARFGPFEPEEVRLATAIRSWTDEAVRPVDPIDVANEVARRGNHRGSLWPHAARSGLLQVRMPGLVALLLLAGVLLIIGASAFLIGGKPPTLLQRTVSVSPGPTAPADPYGGFGAWPAGPHLLPSDGTNPPFDLAFRLDAQLDGDWNRWWVDLETDRWKAQVWWRVGVADEGCVNSALAVAGSNPSPTHAYDRLRTMPIFEASNERPFRFAGSIGQSVDLALTPGWQARCPGKAGQDGGQTLMLTGAGKGLEAGHLTLPAGWRLRIARVDVLGHPLLVAIAGSSDEDLSAAASVLDTFHAQPRASPTASP
jgi:hypothetical protein